MGSERRPEPHRQRQQPAMTRRPPAAPSNLLVRYEDQTPDHYIVRDLAADRVIEVP